MKRILLLALAFCASWSFAGDISPLRTGPVSAYGQLVAGKNSNGQGRIYGSCQGVQDGAEVQVRGMSLYWSLLANATDFWNATAISTMVNDMNIQIVRAAMATGIEDWGGPYKGYQLDAANQKALVSAAVEAAIQNDIYVIIDWHSHTAHEQTSSAVGFFTEMAQTYGSYDNVIFEIYNEPTVGEGEWSTVKNYANTVIAAIRQHSDNLIIVGTPSWDQNPQVAISDPVTDAANNTAYALHYYANSHCWSGSYEWGGKCEGTKGLEAMNAGLSVFVSEWGTGNSDGKGTPDESRNLSWQNYLNENKLSWANWSASKIDEGTAAFTSGATASALQYSTSGNLVKGYLSTNPTVYTACADSPVPVDTASAAILSGSLGKNPIANIAGDKLFLSGMPTSVGIYDVQGRVLLKLENVSGTLSLSSLRPGRYLLRAGASVQAFQIR